MASKSASHQEEENTSYPASFRDDIREGPLQVDDLELGRCSSSCAHFSALAPSGTFPPGTCADQITHRQLESLNLVLLTILAAELDESFSKAPPTLLIESRPPARWTRVEFECLKKVICYREAEKHESSAPSIVWSLDDISCETISGNGLKQLIIRDNAFVKCLISPDIEGCDGMVPQPGLSLSKGRGIRRAHSMPELRRLKMQDLTMESRASLPDTVINGIRLSNSTDTGEGQNTVSWQDLKQRRGINNLRPSQSSRLANLVRSEVATRAALSGNDIVQSVSQVVGTVATVVGSVAAVALCMKENRRSRRMPRQSTDRDIELQDLNTRGRDDLPPVATQDDSEAQDGASGGDSSQPLTTARPEPAQTSEGSSDNEPHNHDNCSTENHSSELQDDRCVCGYYRVNARDFLAVRPQLLAWVTEVLCHSAGLYEKKLCGNMAKAWIQSRVEEVWRNRGMAERYKRVSIDYQEQTLHLNRAWRERDELQAQLLDQQDNSKKERNELQEKLQRQSKMLSQLQQQSTGPTELHKQHFQLVLRDLVTSVCAKELKSQRADFDRTVSAEVDARTRPLRRRFEAEAKRQAHNRQVQEAEQKRLSELRQHLDAEVLRLKLAGDALAQRRGQLEQDEAENARKNAKLQSDVRELEAILQAQDIRATRRKDEWQKLSKGLNEREKQLQLMDKNGKESLFRQRMELVRREAAVAEREKALGK